MNADNVRLRRFEYDTCVTIISSKESNTEESFKQTIFADIFIPVLYIF